MKGKPIKKPIRQVTHADIVEGVLGVEQTINNLKNLESNLVKQVDTKIEEVENKIEELETTVDSLLTGLKKAHEFIEDTKEEALQIIDEVKEGRPGKDADEEYIVKTVLDKVPKIDKEAIIKEAISRVPKLDEKKFKNDILSLVPRKSELNFIKESVDPQDILEKMLELDEDKLVKLRLKLLDNEGLHQTIRSTVNQLKKGYLHGGGISNITGLIDAGNNITITGTGTAGDPYVINSTGGGGTPGGSTTQLQYNNAGAFGGISGATTNGTAVTYTTGNLIAHDVKASQSAGMDILSNSGTVTALFGAGGGANSTFYGGSKFDYATASTIGIFDGSKNLISADTATYPSLTELSYVKGVTSAIQTQINNITNTHTLAAVSALSTDATKSLYTMTSTIPVEFETSDNNTLLYLDESNERVGIGASSPRARLQVDGAGGANIAVLIKGGGSQNADFLQITDSTGSLEYFSVNPTGIVFNEIGSSGVPVRIEGDNNINLFYTDAVNDRIGISTASPDRLLHTEVSDAVTNAVTYAQRLSHITSGTAATSFGVGTEYELENASGTNRIAGTEEFTWSDATDATEDATYKLRLIKAGTLTDIMTVTSEGTIKAEVAGFTLVSSAHIKFAGQSTISNASDGVVTLWNAARDNFSRLQFGGTTSSFPSIKRSTTGFTLRLADDSAITWQLASKLVEANTAGSGSPNIITEAESGTVFTNEGATAENYHTLPTAVTGLTYTFYVDDADGIRVVANTGDLIQINGVVSSSAGYCESLTIGSSVTLTAINATDWVATSVIGTWSLA